MGSREDLEARIAGRDALLDRIRAQVATDARIVAAWLFGSISRGSADGMSDIDLWLVVADEAIDAIAEARRSYVAQIGTPLMVYDGVQNAPEGGAYLMVLYPGQRGPYQVDWYWQPLSAARLPKRAQVLFDKVGIPVAAPLPGPLEPREPRSAEERAEEVTRAVSFFWVMVNIAGKIIARHESWGAVSTLGMLDGTMQRVRWLTGDRPDHPGFGVARTDRPPVLPQDQLALLRALSKEMEQLTPRIKQAGGEVPENAVPHIYEFLDLSAEIVAEGDAASLQ